MDKNFTRLLDTLAVVQRTDRLTTPQIRERLEARGHHVTARTVQRDLEDLATSFPLECDQRTRPYGWRWRDSAPRLALPAMDWPEAISFHLLSTYLKGVLPVSVQEAIQPYVDEARRKLSQHFDNLPLRRWPERVRVIAPGPAFLPPKISRAVHVATTQAILLGRRLKIRYLAFDQKTAKAYIVSPLGLVQHGAVFYVPVRFDGHEDIRTITLHRVQRADVLADPSGIEDFDLSGWIEQGGLGFGGETRVQLVLRLFESAGDLLIEAPLSADQTAMTESTGVHLVRASVLDTQQLRRWLLSLGARVEVVAPVTLRRHIAQSLRTAASHYRS